MQQTAKINIELPRDMQLEVENYCHEKGISFSQYFTYLHGKEMRTSEKCKELAEDISEAINEQPRRTRKR